MTPYTSEEQLYQSMRLLFEHMRRQMPNPIDQLAASRLLIRLRITQPAAEIFVNGRQSPVSIHYGSSKLRPDLDAEMSAETLHQILSDTLSLKRALADRRVKVMGPIWKTASLVEILHQGRALYPAVLRQQGLE